MDRSHTAESTLSGLAGMTTGVGRSIGMALGGDDSDGTKPGKQGV
jgi:hypothetical protein